MIDQEQFLYRVNRKNPQGWKELYKVFYGALCSYSFTIVGDREYAEDIVQESLIKIWKSNIHFPVFKALSVYLYRSVYNNSLKFMRDKHIYEERIQKWFEEQESYELCFFNYAVEEEVIRQIKDIIHDLPEQRRRVILMSMEGYSQQTIADTLHITVNTIKTHKKRAYALFKKRIVREEWILLMVFMLNI